MTSRRQDAITVLIVIALVLAVLLSKGKLIEWVHSDITYENPHEIPAL